MTRCTRAAFVDRDTAVQAKRILLRQYRDASRRAPALSVGYCESCDKYHVIADKTRYPFTDRCVRILECLAQGYRDRETATIVHLTQRTVEWEIGLMMKRFNALSRANLVAIVIALGLINPNTFMPTSSEDEIQHA